MMTSSDNSTDRDTSSRGEERTLCVIPARGGSQRVLRKNIREFCGRPMIAWTIEAAIRSDCVSRTIVSTDDADTAEIATACGAEVPFIRDAAIADAISPVSLVAVDALDRLDPDARIFSRVAMLLPNCPMRTAEDIAAAYDRFAETDADSQLSVTSFGWQNPWWAMQRDDSQRLSMLFPQYITTRSQDLPDLFCPSGAVWWIKADVLRRERTFHIEGRTGFELSWQNGFDIDTEEDWELARLLMQERLRSSQMR